MGNSTMKQLLDASKNKIATTFVVVGIAMPLTYAFTVLLLQISSLGEELTVSDATVSSLKNDLSDAKEQATEKIRFLTEQLDQVKLGKQAAEERYTALKALTVSNSNKSLAGTPSSPIKSSSPRLRIQQEEKEVLSKEECIDRFLTNSSQMREKALKAAGINFYLQLEFKALYVSAPRCKLINYCINRDLKWFYVSNDASPTTQKKIEFILRSSWDNPIADKLTHTVERISEKSFKQTKYAYVEETALYGPILANHIGHGLRDGILSLYTLMDLLDIPTRDMWSFTGIGVPTWDLKNNRESMAAQLHDLISNHLPVTFEQFWNFFPKDTELMCFDKLLTGVYPSDETAEAARKMRNFILDHLGLTKFIPKEKTLVLSLRGDHGGRGVHFSDNTIKKMTSFFENAGFEVVPFDGYGKSYLEQLTRYLNSTHIVGVRGSQMYANLFANYGTKILEVAQWTSIVWQVGLYHLDISQYMADENEFQRSSFKFQTEHEINVTLSDNFYNFAKKSWNL